MKRTQKWIGHLVVLSIAVGAVGMVSVSQAQAASDITLTKLQRQYHENEWRRMHPDWNGRLYWHRNGYYYDRAHTNLAIVDNDWTTISGGVVLNNDPYIAFSGTYGSMYPTASLDIDLGSSDRVRHARAEVFQHPYFWRNGTRYDRTTVTRRGTTYYRFTRHHF